MKAIIAMVGALALAACADDQQPYDEEEPGDGQGVEAAAEAEPVAEIESTEQALGEAGCSSVFVSPFGNSNGRRRSVAVGNNIQSSPDWTYNNPGCRYQYITEYHSLGPVFPFHKFTAGAAARGSSLDPRGPLATITNKTDCERTRLTVGVYIWNTNTPAYTTLHTFAGRGRWFNPPGFFPPPYCATDKTLGTLAGPTAQFNGTKHKVRVAARVLYCFDTGCIPQLATDLGLETRLTKAPLPFVFPTPVPVPTPHPIPTPVPIPTPHPTPH